ncbi:hypothetical protein VTH06DRAFT_4988 [Thermothelomyces fergusii]
MANPQTDSRIPSLRAKAKSSPGSPGAGTPAGSATNTRQRAEGDAATRACPGEGLAGRHDERRLSPDDDAPRDADGLSPILGPFSSPWEGAEQWRKTRIPSTPATPPQPRDGPDSDRDSDSEWSGRPLLPFLRRLELIEQHLHGALALGRGPAGAGGGGVQFPDEESDDDEGEEEEDEEEEEDDDDEADGPAGVARSLRALGVRTHPVERAVAVRFVKAPRPLEVQIHAASASASASASPAMSPIFDAEYWESRYTEVK